MFTTFRMAKTPMTIRTAAPLNMAIPKGSVTITMTNSGQNKNMNAASPKGNTEMTMVASAISRPISPDYMNAASPKGNTEMTMAEIRPWAVKLRTFPRDLIRLSIVVTMFVNT